MPAPSLPVVEAPLTFTAPSREKPQVLMSANHAEPNKRTGELHAVPVAITDARALPEPPTLDREGFALVPHETEVTDFYDKRAVEEVYYPEIVRLLQTVTGATEVHIFDHTLRVEDEAKRRAHGTRLPVSVVHNDYTERSGPQRVSDVLPPGTVERFLAHRFAMVNVWRSFGASAERFPLAIADGRTLPPVDYIAVDIVYPDRTGEIYQSAYSPGQHWYYFSGLRRNEALLLKCFDSAADGRTRYTAHSGFVNPRAPADTPPRESIEIRTLLSFAPAPVGG
jgi:hypothetical protein